MKADDDLVSMAMYRRLAARIDKLSSQLDGYQRKDVRELQGEVAALKRAVAILAQRMEPGGGQPDWLACRDPQQAQTILTEITDWLDECGRPLGLRPLPCWPWHPPAVVLLLAGQQHYRGAYAGEATVAVVDLLTRYLSAIQTSVHGAMRKQGQNQCTDDFHIVADGQYLYDVTRTDALAIWWATDREGLPPGLRHRNDAAA